jgi:hypothetical protein
VRKIERDYSSLHAPSSLGPGGFLSRASRLVDELDSDLVTAIEDFNQRLTDVAGPASLSVNEFTNSGFTLTGKNTPSSYLVRCNHSAADFQIVTAETSSLLVIYPGATQDSGINVRHNAQGRASAPASAGHAHFNLQDLNFGLFGGREVFWSARLLILRDDSANAWDGQIALGLSLPEQDFMVNTTGALTNWLNDGGIVFHLGRDKQLTLNVRAATTTRVVGTIDLSAELAVGQGGLGIDVGFHMIQDPGYPFGGGGSVQMYERRGARAPWRSVGSPLTGTVFPTTAQRYGFHCEVGMGVGPYSLFIDHVASAITRETKVEE